MAGVGGREKLLRMKGVGGHAEVLSSIKAGGFLCCLIVCS